MPVLGLDEGRERCAKLFGHSVRPTGVSYVYEAPALSEKVEKLEPGLRCDGVNSDRTAVQSVIVGAAVDARLPEPGPVDPPREEGAFSPQWTHRVDVGSEGTHRARAPACRGRRTTWRRSTTGSPPRACRCSSAAVGPDTLPTNGYWRISGSS